jgi:carbon-monoxide dehydrogenase medium subunit
MYAFEYIRPVSLAEALDVLRSDVEPRLLAGGQTLLPTLKHRLSAHSTLIDLQGIGDLHEVTVDEHAVTLGAMTRHAEVADHAEINAVLPALAHLAGGIGDPLVRNMGTIGGSIANNDPAADYPAAILGLNATVSTDRRSIAADEFFDGMFSTALEDDEIITTVRFPIPRRAGYFKLPHPASGYVLAGALVAEFGDGVRCAINGVEPCVFRETGVEVQFTSGLSQIQISKVDRSPEDFNEDLFASAEYRERVLPKVVERAVANAFQSH